MKPCERLKEMEREFALANEKVALALQVCREKAAACGDEAMAGLLSDLAEAMEERRELFTEQAEEYAAMKEGRYDDEKRRS